MKNPVAVVVAVKRLLTHPRVPVDRVLQVERMPTSKTKLFQRAKKRAILPVRNTNPTLLHLPKRNRTTIVPKIRNENKRQSTTTKSVKEAETKETTKERLDEPMSSLETDSEIEV
jgi:hypothetical protein